MLLPSLYFVLMHSIVFAAEEPVNHPAYAANVTNTSITSGQNRTDNVNRTVAVAEGGLAIIEPIKPASINVSSNITTINATKPVVEKTAELPHTTVARKGVTELHADIKNTTPPVVIVKKPLLLESSDDDDVSGTSSREPLKDLLSKNFDVEKEQRNTAAYVIPIVGVIFSVPLVAFLMSVLYKRCSEWWTHRHYRRMDFLIEGMYNN